MNALVILVAVILFPGLIATVICDKLVIHSRRWQAFQYSIYSFIFGVLSYTLVQILYWLIEILFGASVDLLRVWSIVTSQQSDISFREIFWASVAAPFIAAIAVLVSNKKYLTKIAWKFGISNKYDDENLFTYYLNSDEVQYIYVRDPSVNQTYRGQVWQYSETDHIQEIVLADVTIHDYESSDELYKLRTIYLARPIGTFTIEQANMIEGNAENGKEATA